MSNPSRPSPFHTPHHNASCLQVAPYTCQSTQRESVLNVERRRDVAQNLPPAGPGEAVLCTIAELHSSR